MRIRGNAFNITIGGVRVTPSPVMTELPFELMSVRLRNCLGNARIFTYEDLGQKHTCDLFRLRNFGRKTYNELRELTGIKELHKPVILKPIKETHLNILKIRKAGATLREVGVQYSLTPGRIRQICLETEKRIEHRKKYGLTEKGGIIV